MIPTHENEPPPSRRGSSVSGEVPATVVCARCGRPDCPGCDPDEEDTIQSRVLVPVPWEQNESSIFRRFWSTVQLSCREPIRFFSGLPKGNLGAPLWFALLIEGLSVGSWIVLFGIAFYAVFPTMCRTLWTNSSSRNAIIRVLLVSWTGFSALLISARLIYGSLLERGALDRGSRSRKNYVQRFSLYSTGWDLMTSPVGVLLGLLLSGKSVSRDVRGALRAPTLATTAFLELVYQLKKTDIDDVRRSAVTIAVTQSAILSLVLLVITVLLGLW